MNDNFAPAALSVEARWRAIDRAMREDPDWIGGVQELAVELHDAAERIATPQRLHAYGHATIGRLTRRLAEEAQLRQIELTVDQVDLIVAALFSTALNLARSFPARSATA